MKKHKFKIGDKVKTINLPVSNNGTIRKRFSINTSEDGYIVILDKPVKVPEVYGDYHCSSCVFHETYLEKI